MNIDQGRNYFSCESFGHFARNYRNQEIMGQERRIKYRKSQNARDNLKEKKILVVLD